MRAVLLRISLVVVVCLGLAACGGNSPTPKPYSGPSKSASASVSGAPTLPAEAMGTSDASQIAFVRHYLAVLSYATVSGETGALKTLGLPICISCTKALDAINKIYNAGGYVHTRGFDLRSASIEPKRVRGNPVIHAVLTVYAQETQANSSSSPAPSAQALIEARFLLSRSNGEWFINQWTRAS